ncbi:hypothetical protein H5410_055754, partial [Solanum commersonii]
MSTARLNEVLGERQRTRMVQFLMKLRPEFESIRGSLLNREVTHALDVVLAARNTKRSVQCYECINFGHIVANCPKKKKNCAYCKIIGHHILDCRRCPNHLRPAHQAYHTDVTKSVGSFPFGHDLKRLIRDSIAAALPETISSALS